MESTKSHKQNKKNSQKITVMCCSKSGNKKASYFCWKRHLLIAVIFISESRQFQSCNFQTWSKVDSIKVNHYFH